MQAISSKFPVEHEAACDFCMEISPIVAVSRTIGLDLSHETHRICYSCVEWAKEWLDKAIGEMV